MQITGLISFLVVMLLFPYVIIGEFWGLVWFSLTAPFSYIFEKTIGIGKDSYFVIFLATFLQATWISILIILLFSKYKRISKNHKNIDITKRSSRTR